MFNENLNRAQIRFFFIFTCTEVSELGLSLYMTMVHTYCQLLCQKLGKSDMFAIEYQGGRRRRRCMHACE